MIRKLNENYNKIGDFIENIVVNVHFDTLNEAIREEIEGLMENYNIDYQYNNDTYYFVISEGHSVSIETYNNIICVNVYEDDIKSERLCSSTIRLMIDWDKDSNSILMFVRGHIGDNKINKVIDDLVGIRPIISNAILSCLSDF